VAPRRAAPGLAPARRGRVRGVDRLPKGRKLAPELARRLGAGEPIFWSATTIYDETQKASLLSAAYRERVNGLTSFEAVRPHLERIGAEKPSSDFLERLIYCELKLRLAELLLMRVDKITMATSVETRVPFLDHKLVEFAMTIPRSMKVRDGQNKWVLKKALEGIVPDDLLYRPKQGFALPINEWCISGMAPFVERTLFSSPLRQRELFDYDAVRGIWEAHRSGRVDYSFNIWCLLNLSLWYEHWIEGRPYGVGLGTEGGSHTESRQKTNDER
jgi:asparagine synthase (glutamine-hydrolysing)